jgi:hypothetical protein
MCVHTPHSPTQTRPRVHACTPPRLHASTPPRLHASTHPHTHTHTQQCLDYSNQRLPAGYELVWSRDSLQHVPLHAAYQFLNNVKASGARYLLVGSYVRSKEPNVDIAAGCVTRVCLSVCVCECVRVCVCVWGGGEGGEGRQP